MAHRWNQLRKQLFEFIVNYKAGHDGNSPSVREMATALGYRTTCVVRLHLDSLELAGLIKVDNFKARGIRVVGARWVPPSRPAPLLVDSQQRENSETSPFPMPGGPAQTFFPAGAGAGDGPGHAAQ